ncbi:Uncharacterised protein [Streptococcus pneumoniae]|nr:Uncharacterised protein [Streptococcus pneumoniae]
MSDAFTDVAKMKKIKASDSNIRNPARIFVSRFFRLFFFLLFF